MKGMCGDTPGFSLPAPGPNTLSPPPPQWPVLPSSCCSFLRSLVFLSAQHTECEGLFIFFMALTVCSLAPPGLTSTLPLEAQSKPAVLPTPQPHSSSASAPGFHTTCAGHVPGRLDPLVPSYSGEGLGFFS